MDPVQDSGESSLLCKLTRTSIISPKQKRKKKRNNIICSEYYESEFKYVIKLYMIKND